MPFSLIVRRRRVNRHLYPPRWEKAFPQRHRGPRWSPRFGTRCLLCQAVSLLSGLGGDAQQPSPFNSKRRRVAKNSTQALVTFTVTPFLVPARRSRARI